MAASERNGTAINEDQARRLVCTHLAEFLQKGNCTVRVRRLRDERRVTFLGEANGHWQSTPAMDYHDHQAERIMDALLSVGAKRNRDLHVQVHSSGNHDDVTIGFNKEAALQHRGNLYQYVYGQLFWD